MYQAAGESALVAAGLESSAWGERVVVPDVGAGGRATMLGMSPVNPAPLRVRISAFSGVVRVAAESRSDVVVDRGGVAAEAQDGSVEIAPRRRSDAVAVRCPVG